MAQQVGLMPVTITVLDSFAYVARVEGASMHVRLYLSLSLSLSPHQFLLILLTLGYKNRYLRVPDGHFWIQGDHQGHSLDSNSFGPVSLGLVHVRASHIFWPPNRPLLNWHVDTTEEEED
uniref:Peptidase S26 domain-containing protein n=1 Tax=Salmo trutta TaxID=8032 RepID=A0A674APE3_SALTR